MRGFKEASSLLCSPLPIYSLVCYFFLSTALISSPLISTDHSTLLISDLSCYPLLSSGLLFSSGGSCLQILPGCPLFAILVDQILGPVRGHTFLVTFWDQIQIVLPSHLLSALGPNFCLPDRGCPNSKFRGTNSWLPVRGYRVPLICRFGGHETQGFREYSLLPPSHLLCFPLLC